MEQILGSWKEIAAYLAKSTRTVQRWELELRLPVHRPVLSARHIVMAKKSEIDRWVEESSLLKPSFSENPDADLVLPTVLIAEGHEGTRCMLGSLLELFGYPVEYSTQSKSAARSFMAPKPVDLLILGSQYANRAGLDLARSLGKIQPSMKVLLLLDGEADSASADDLDHFAGWPVLAAPFRADEFLYAVQALLNVSPAALSVRYANPLPINPERMASVLGTVPCRVVDADNGEVNIAA